MNNVQNLIDRELGIYCRFNYDNVLKRLVVDREESYYGLQSGVVLPYDLDPPIFACRFSEAPGYEHILALANEDGRVCLQDTTDAITAKHLESYQCHNNAVFDLAWMPGQMKFVTVSGDHTACLWDVAEGAPKRIATFSSHTRSVKTAVFRPCEPSVFATGARDGHILVWDSRAAAPAAPAAAVLRPDHSQAAAAVLRPDNSLLHVHAGAAPRTPGSHGKRARAAEPRAASVTGLVFRDAHTLLSCGECDGNIKAWDLRKSYSAFRREPLPARSIPYCGASARHGYTNLALDDARTRLYASCMDDVIYCFNVSAYAPLPERRFVGHQNSTFYIKTCLSPDGAYLVSGSSDTFAYVWSVRRAEPLARLGGHRAEVTCAAWARAPEPRLVTCGDDARHLLWRVGREAPAPGAAPPPGRAEPAPRAAAPAPRPQWGALERTPRAAPPPAPPSARRTKRCLAALLDATRDADEAESLVKRLKLDGDAGDGRRAALAGVKRPRPRSPSPASPRRASPPPSPARLITFATPTEDLPDFVLNGEAPHLRLMSPPKKRRDTPDWLTLLARGRRGEAGDGAPAAAVAVTPTTPKENFPSRRNSVSDRTPKSAKKPRTLLKYFNIAQKEK